MNNKKPSVLFVDASIKYFDLLNKINKNYELTYSNNYKEALNKILNNNFNLILANNKIQDFNILEFNKSLNLNGINLPIIIIADSIINTELINLFRKGAKDFILKNKEFAETADESVNRIIKELNQEKKIKKEVLDNKKYKALIEGVDEAVFLQSPNGDILDCNEFACKMFGYTKDEIIKKNVVDFVTKEYIETLPEIITEKDTTLGIPYESINKRRDGSFFPVIFSTRIVEVNNNNYILSYVKDITKIKKIEKNLKTSEKKIISIFKVMKDLVLEIDDSGKYLFISDTNTSKNLLYKSKKEVLGKTLHEIFTKEQADFFLNGIKRALKENNPVTLEYPLKINNKIVWFETSLTPYSEHSVLFIGRDITQRKNDEYLKDTIFNISNSINYSNNLEKLFKNIHKELSKIINTNNLFIATYNKQTDKISFPYIIDEKNDDFSGKYENTLTSYLIKSDKSMILYKKDILLIEKNNKIKFYGQIPEIFIGVPLKNNKNKNFGMIGLIDYDKNDTYNENDKKILEFVSTQISRTIQRKKLEINLFNSKIKAEESDRLKSAFLANMSHEIRTPLNSIIGFSELLSDKEIYYNDKDKFIGIIHNNGLHLLELINNIIDISKIEAGAMNVSESFFSVNNLMIDLYNNFKSDFLILKNNIDFILKNNLSDDESFIYTDNLKLRQILTNLLSNAIKNTEKGFIKFGYSKILNEEDNKYYLKFFVKDSGIGISKFEQQIIFKRFMQANITKDRLQHGTGLGLALCKSISEILGGNIWVESEINKGSTFFFTIPFNTKSDN